MMIRHRPLRHSVWLIALLAGWTHAAPAHETVQIPSSQWQGSLRAEVYAPPHPARGIVLALHGCAGLYRGGKAHRATPAARYESMAQQFVDAGYVAVFPDSLGSRGLGSICHQGRTRVIQESDRAADARDAMAWIRSQPWGTDTPVALLGWSHGGSSVLEAMDSKQPPLGVVMAIAFYPGCVQFNNSQYRQTLAPLVLYVGALDDWTDPQACVRLGDRVGAHVQVYPDSYHGFDEPYMPLREVSGIHRASGTVTVHQGSNPAARQAAYRDVFQRLSEVFHTP